MIRRMSVFLISAAVLYGDSASPNALTVTFNGGTALEIHTESSRANSPLSTSGSVAISDRNQVTRTVVDNQGRPLFSYDIEAVPDGAGRYTIRIRPHDPNQINMSYFTFAPGDQLTVDGARCIVRGDGKIAGDAFGEVLASGLSVDRLAAAVATAIKARGGSARPDVRVTAARRDVPTVASLREFRSVRIGEAVSLDILSNPSTGERIFDVIQPIPPREHQAVRTPVKLEDEFSLMKIRVSINGKTVEEPNNSWIIGGAVKMSLPGHGTVYLATQPITTHAFAPVGRAEGKRLTFPIGADFVEITGADNVLKKSSYRTIWVYWDQRAANTDTVDITCADTITSLLPK